MSESTMIQITFLLWLLSCQYHPACGQWPTSAVGYSSLSSLVMCTAVSLQVAHSRVVYVTPNATTPCPKNSSCYTLNWYSCNGSKGLLSNDTVMVLLKGTHSLNSTIYVKNCINLTITGDVLSLTGGKDQTPHPVSWINCTSSDTGIAFFNTMDVHIMNLGFDSCGGNVALDSDTSKFNVSAALLFGLSYNVSIVQVTINNTNGYGVHMNCVFGNIQINDSILVRASKARDGKLGGNARFWFGKSSNCKHQCNKKHANLVIFRSSFMLGLKGSIGIEIVIDCPHVYTLMSNVYAINNTGGNVALRLTNFNVYAPSKIHIINSIINGGRANTGGGIKFWSRHNEEGEHTCENFSANTYSTLLTVSDTNFSFNSAKKYGGGVYISYYQSAGYLCQVEKVEIRFNNCTFVNNFGNGAVMESKQHLTSVVYPGLLVLNVSLENCHFHGNSVPNNKSGPIIYLILTYMTISNSSFVDNNGSVLTLLKSNVNFHGDISFVNNHADYGAALRVCESSLIFLNKNTRIWFTNNTAIFKGGAVYGYQSCMDTIPPCLFQPKLHKNVSAEVFEEALKLQFVNNSASIAGDAIYGGSLDSCFTIINYSKLRNDSMLSVFDMSGQTGPSWVSSDPQGVCFCDINERPSHIKCHKKHPVTEAYPGARFNVSLITVGQLNGSTPGSIKVTLDNSDNDGSDKLIVKRGRSASSSKCENITLTLQSKQNDVAIHFDTVPMTGYLPSLSVNVTISLKHCPLGFIKNGEYGCDCDYPVLCAQYGCPYNLVCDIDKQEILIQAYIWFGCLENSSSMASCSFASGHSCTYCNRSHMYRAVNVFEIDDQCLPGRTGVMCGACKLGLSRILEQFRVPAGCMDCSNRNLAFLVPLFLFSGIILVVFLTVFNMTVTEGTLNGLIFYSAVAYAHPNVFRIDQQAFPWIFVSWLNLDLGFQICAYNGMTGYQYIWLSFGYISCLVCTQIFIIYLSHKFIFFTRLVQRNVANVLATLIMIFYTRILFVCYHSLYPTTVIFNTDNASQPKFKLVWAFDGNVPYLGLKHTPLFILAIICLLVVLWFTFSLLLIQCLQRRSSICCLHWVERLRPFYEAYTGPCNNNYRFWPGLLLLLRLGLFLTEARQRIMALVAGICFLIIPLACIFPHGVYKKWPLNILEFLFVLNLSITFLAVELADNAHSDHVQFLVKRLAAQFSTSFVLVMFFGILFYHVYGRIKGTFVWKIPTKWVSASMKKLQSVKLRWSHNSESDDETAPLLPQPLPPVIKFPDYLEPLLED